MYILKFVGDDIAWIARNLPNMEDSIFGPKLARHTNPDSSNFDVVDTNDNTPSLIKTSDVETVRFLAWRTESEGRRNDGLRTVGIQA